MAMVGEAPPPTSWHQPEGAEGTDGAEGTANGGRQRQCTVGRKAAVLLLVAVAVAVVIAVAIAVAVAVSTDGGGGGTSTSTNTSGVAALEGSGRPNSTAAGGGGGAGAAAASTVVAAAATATAAAGVAGTATTGSMVPAGATTTAAPGATAAAPLSDSDTVWGLAEVGDAAALARVVASRNLTALQQLVVAKLSGRLKVAVPGGAAQAIPERSTAVNRALAAGYLQAVLRALGLAPEVQRYSATGRNVFAWLNATAGGTRTDADTVVLGAHYDTVARSPGANDNASGVALVLGVALQLVAAANRSRNVLFVLFDEEEIGLVGSREFARKLAAPGSGVDVHSAHTVDQMGWDNDGDRAFELELPCAACVALYERAAARAAAAEGRTIRVNIHLTDVTSTDHTSFRNAGFQAVGLTEE